MQTFIDFFDPANIDHIIAYNHLQLHGTWPEGFIPDTVELDANWYLQLMIKMANYWVEYMTQTQ
jgi:hypothetical protein